MPDFNYDPGVVEVVPIFLEQADQSTPEAVRTHREWLTALMPTVDPPDRIVQEDRVIDGLDGAPRIRVRVYRRSDSQRQALPGVLQIHGGGFTTGTIEMMDDYCHELVLATDIVIIAVDYRLAPEHPYPAGLDDCMAALRWVHDSVDELGLDPDRIAIAGQSAGGGLCAGLALRARDEGGPAICFQHLEVPELDHRLSTPSMLAFQDTPAFNRNAALWSWKHYLGLDDTEPDPDAAVSPYASPSRADDLSGLPPAFVSVMEYDPLRDEGILYALGLLQAGVQTELHAYPGTFHGSGLATEALTSRQAVADRLRAYDRALNLWT